jgi:hypothetical protein
MIAANSDSEQPSRKKTIESGGGLPREMMRRRRRNCTVEKEVRQGTENEGKIY